MAFFFNKLKTGITFFSAGMIDRISSRFTGRQCSFAKHIASKLSGCQPWTDHFESSAISGITSALAAKDFMSARGLAAFGSKEGASKYCVNLAEKAIELIAMGEEPMVEYFTFLSE